MDRIWQPHRILHSWCV